LNVRSKALSSVYVFVLGHGLRTWGCLLKNMPSELDKICYHKELQHSDEFIF